MNKSAVFRLKLSFPNVTGLALHQWNYQFVETVAGLYEKQFLCRERTRMNGSLWRRIYQGDVVYM